MNTSENHEDERVENEETLEDQGVPLGDNPYLYQRQPVAEPDLDANAPTLRASELRRMNRRALLFLIVVVVLLLFVAYWMFTSAGNRDRQPNERKQQVTVSEAPSTLTAPPMPPVPSAPPPPIPVQPIPLAPKSSAPPLPVTSHEVATHSGPTLLQRRIAASNSGAGGRNRSASRQTASRLAGAKLPNGESSGQTSAHPLGHADTLMQRGTYIRCVLETRIVSDVPGFTTCLVSEPVYSFNGHTLLLPKGSKILGFYQQKPVGERMEVVWDRIITPTGIDVNMKSPGIDNLGGAGLPGDYDAHWAQRVSSALLISLLSDAFKYEAAEHGPRNTTVGNGFVTQTPYQSNTADTVQRLADQAVREAATRPPTVTINQGTIIYVYVARDVDFSGVVARS